MKAEIKQLIAGLVLMSLGLTGIYYMDKTDGFLYVVGSIYATLFGAMILAYVGQGYLAPAAKYIFGWVPPVFRWFGRDGYK